MFIGSPTPAARSTGMSMLVFSNRGKFGCAVADRQNAGYTGHSNTAVGASSFCCVER